MKKAEATRLNILQKSFELIYVKGYQTTSVDEILATTRVTKGAFYYHFKNKDEMGIAIINELLKPSFEAAFIKPLQTAENTLDVLYNLMYEILMNNTFLSVEHGCPAANFTQEMAPWNEDFTKSLNELSGQWKNSIMLSIEKAKERGSIRSDVKPEQVAVFMMSGYWGIRNLGKLDNDKSIYLVYLAHLKSYLEGLK